jgi:glycosyltransferase involved in cell wall biosynthesis
MHLAHFVPRVPPALGGSETYFDRLTRFHRDAGDLVTTWATTAIDLEAFWKSGKAEQVPTISDSVRLYHPLRFPGRRYVLKAASLLPFPRWQAATMPANPICPAMWRDAGRFAGPLDAVHATPFPYAFPILCAVRLADRRKVPFFLTPFLHLGDPTNPADRTKKQYTSRPLRWLLGRAEKVFVQTNLEREAVRGFGIPDERIVLQGLGVDPVECSGGDRDGWRRSLGIGPGEFVIGHLANNSVEKGTVDLLRACERMKSPFRVALAGPEMTNFKRYWESYPRKDRVTRLGVLSDVQKRDFFAGIDVFGLPSRSDSFGLVLLEAWANAKPVVVYRAGGPAAIVRHEEDGLIVPCGDVDSLAGQFIRLDANDALRAELGQTGRARLATEFAWPEKLSIVRNVIRKQNPI